MTQHCPVKPPFGARQPSPPTPVAPELADVTLPRPSARVRLEQLMLDGAISTVEYERRLAALEEAHARRGWAS